MADGIPVVIKDGKGIALAKGAYRPETDDVKLNSGAVHTKQWLTESGYIIVSVAEATAAAEPPTSQRLADDYAYLNARARELGSRFI